ncbi:MAG: hypothetical protein ACI8WB_004700 [Phenylobacterium sp.]|jgi:hypothetical protein
MEIADKQDDVNSDSLKSSTLIGAELSAQALAELRYQAMASFNDIVVIPQSSD